MKKTQKRNDDFAFYICFTIALFILLSLGNWQIQRYKNTNHISNIKNISMSIAPIDISNYILEDLSFRRVYAQGQLLRSKTIILEPRTYNGRVGGHILVPLKVNNGYVLVNRGFIKREKIDNFRLKNKNDLKGIINIKGIAFVPPKPNKFLLKNDLTKNKWYTLNVSEIKSYLKLKIAPYILYEIRENEDNIKNVTVPIKKGINHIQYAITWFSLAMCLCLIGALYKRRENIESKS